MKNTAHTFNSQKTSDMYRKRVGYEVFMIILEKHNRT